MEGFKIQQNTNKYHRRSTRLKDYDYSQSGHYFVTICTNNREEYFTNERIKQIAQRFWSRIPNHFTNIRLDKWVIMPNHIHGIIIIDDSVGARHGVPNEMSKQDQTGISGYEKGVPRHAPTVTFGPLKRNSLSSIINHFKGNVKRWCNGNGLEYFQWQRNYYEHVIRNEKSLNNIRRYIINNPDRWSEDIENIKNNSARVQTRHGTSQHYDDLFV